MSRGLLIQRVAEALEISPAEAEKAIDAVHTATRDLLGAARSVPMLGVGTLKSRIKRRWIKSPGPNRGNAIEERVVTLQHGAVLWAGEPYEA
jgi:nucleoid DNA-binding protein